MNAFFKTIIRTFKNHKLRLNLSCLIVFISMFFAMGVPFNVKSITNSFLENINSEYISDVIVKSKQENGFTSDYYEYINEQSEIFSKEHYFSADFENAKQDISRIYYRDITSQINKLTLQDGRIPESPFEVLSDFPRGIRNNKIGDVVTIKFNDYTQFDVTIVGIVKSPLYTSNQDELYLNDLEKKVNNILYFSSSFDLGQIPKVFVPTNESALKLSNNVSYASSYLSNIDRFITMMTNELGTQNIQGLSLNDNISFVSFDNEMSIYLKFALIISIFFGLVCSLVLSITFNRLIKDERSSIGCYLSLGVSKKRIIWKYILYVLLVCIVSGIIGSVVGLISFNYIVRSAFSTLFELGPVNWMGSMLIGTVVLVVIILITVGCSLFTLLSYFKESPNNLFFAVPPKEGRKLFLERIKFLWAKIGFFWKYSLRNIFRYIKNTLLTIISIISCTAIVFFGFSMFDNSLTLAKDPVFGKMAEPMVYLTAFVVFAGCLLCVFIMFNLLSMNVDDRKKELSALKVIGFNDKECLLYTFREVSLLTIVGLILGIPISYGVCYLLIQLLKFGNVNNTRWYSYVLTALLIILSNLFTNLILYRRVKGIKMEESFKTIE